MIERYNGEPLPRFTKLEPKEIHGHTVEIFERDQTAITELERKIADTPLSDDGVKQHLEVFMLFLKNPLIVDDFGDGEEKHFKRTDWRNEILASGDKASYDFLDSNILKGNNLSGVLSRYELIQTFVDQLGMHHLPEGAPTQQFKELVTSGLSLYREMNETYGKKTVEERIVFAKRVSAHTELVVRGILNLFKKEEKYQSV